MIIPLASQAAQRTILRWAVMIALVLWPLLLPALLPALRGRGGAPRQWVSTTVTTRSYAIRGSTPEALRQQLTANGPREPNGQAFDALTTWSVAWSWPVFLDGSCALNQARITLQATVTLPRWTPPPDSDPVLVHHWEQYLNALAQHEATHVALARGDLPTLAQAIHGATCATASAAATAVLAQMRQHQGTYDALTAHGARQGAVFP